jgi:hypothetical protein
MTGHHSSDLEIRDMKGIKVAWAEPGIRGRFLGWIHFIDVIARRNHAATAE